MKILRTILLLTVLLTWATAQSASAAIANIIVTNFAFVPATTSITVNDEVIWTWPPVNSQNHNVVSASTPSAWADSAILSGPATFTNTFTTAGSFPYLCTVHGFTGSIVVQPAPPAVPFVSITNPVNGSIVSAPASFTLGATAVETNGAITNIEFLEGATVVGNISAPPYAISLTNLSAGNYTFSAIASDINGATVTNSISIQVVAGDVIILAGNLAFGGVPAGSSVSNILTISNGGGTTMTVSNIVYPSGFNGAFSGTIGPGSNQTVAVTFSPSGPGFFGGTIIVNSDAPNGVNTIQASGFGTSGNLTLALLTSGGGKVVPNLNNQTLRAGAKYTIRAVPAAGNVFANWTGSINTNANPLEFTMQAGTLLQANFIPNPLLPFVGTYNGIFMASNGVTETTAGMLKNLTVHPNGNFSAVLFIDGKRRPFSGTFNVAGQSTNTVTCLGTLGSANVVMSLVAASNSPPQVVGTVAASNAVANLLADRAANPLPSAEYTMLIGPVTNAGDGYALITNHAGRVQITGALADGSPLSEATAISQDGYIPIFDNLYNNRGALLGWINLDLTNTTGTGLIWLHPTLHGGLYRQGFTNVFSTNQIQISRWADPPPNLNLLTNLIADGVTNAVTISSSGIISGPATEGSVNLRTGQLKVTIGSGPSKIVGSGTILLDQTNGAGYFLTKTNSQPIQLSP